MKHSFIKQFLYGGVLLAPAFLLTGCIDNSYGDLDDIDLTMGLGSDGLGVKLGNTEKIMLDDILSVDESVKLDGNNLYYLVESDQSNFEVTVNPITIDLGIPELEMDVPVLSYASAREQFIDKFPGIPVPDGTPIFIQKGKGFEPNGEARSTKQSTDFRVEGNLGDLKQIDWVRIQPTRVAIRMQEEKTGNLNFGIKQLKKVRIVLPKELHVSQYDQNIWNYVYDKTYEAYALEMVNPDCPLVMENSNLNICEIIVDRADVNRKVENDNSLFVNSQIFMEGVVDFEVTDDFYMTENDEMSIKIGFVHDPTINIVEVNGRFNPDVEHQTSQINVFNDLPDFLQDKDVVVGVSNPTIKFSSDLRDLPVGFNFGAGLMAVKQGDSNFPKPVPLPSVAIENGQQTTVYYYQGSKPYDPTASEAQINSAVKQYVPNLSDLIETLPDYITVDLGKDQIGVQDKDYTIRMGIPYKVTVAYDIYVPFEFNNKLTIVYRDSTNSFGDDIKDYAAHGVRVSAKIQNTIPLALNLNITAVKADGNPVPDVSFTTLSVPAATTDDLSKPEEKEVTIDGTLSDPNKLKEIDHLVFNVTAAAQPDAEVRKLVSTQYLRLADIRVRLKGQVIANFN